MKILRAELAISAGEKAAKEKTSIVARDFLKSHIPKIRGIMPTITVTHSWGKHRQFADPTTAYTVLVACKAKVELQSLVKFYKAVNKVFKNIGEPNLFWHKQGILLAVGFTVSSKQMEQIADVFG